MPAGVSSTTGIVNKESLKQILFDLAEGKSPHRGYLDLFIGGINKSTLENTIGKTLQDKLENYLNDNFIDDVAKNQLPSNLNIGYFTNGILNTKYNSELTILKNNQENIRNNENNFVSLPNNVKIENEMDIPNTQANVDYKEAIDKIINKGNMTVDLQKNIDILAKNIKMRDSEDFKNKSEKYKNKTLENIKKANIEMPQLIKNCG